MNFRDLEYVVAVSELRSFSKAAASCNVSQPSLSIQIKKLETEIGETIFSRSKQDIELTPIGELVVEKAREALEIKNELERLSRTNSASLAGRIRLGAILTLAPYLFSDLIVFAKKAEPKLTLFLKEAKTEELIRDLIRGKLDAALISLPTDEYVFDVRPIFKENFLLAVPKDHRLAKRKSISDKDLTDERLILLEDGHCFREQALKVCSSLAAKEYGPFKSTSFETIRHLVTAGEGVTLLPESASRAYGDLVCIPVKGAAYSREIALIWRKSSKIKPQLEKLAELIAGTIRGSAVA